MLVYIYMYIVTAYHHTCMLYSYTWQRLTHRYILVHTFMRINSHTLYTHILRQAPPYACTQCIFICVCTYLCACEVYTCIPTAYSHTVGRYAVCAHSLRILCPRILYISDCTCDLSSLHWHYTLSVISSSECKGYINIVNMRAYIHTPSMSGIVYVWGHATYLGHPPRRTSA